MRWAIHCLRNLTSAARFKPNNANCTKEHMEPQMWLAWKILEKSLCKHHTVKDFIQAKSIQRLVEILQFLFGRQWGSLVLQRWANSTIARSKAPFSEKVKMKKHLAYPSGFPNVCSRPTTSSHCHRFGLGLERLGRDEGLDYLYLGWISGWQTCLCPFLCCSRGSEWHYRGFSLISVFLFSVHSHLECNFWECWLSP